LTFILNTTRKKGMKNPTSILPVSQEQPMLPRAENFKDVPHKKIIRDLGLKVTHQRVTILTAIRSGPAHFTAQEVFELVNEKNPDIGFATVYRFLKKLSEENFVTEVRMGGLPARYEWSAKEHHDHLTCVKCQTIVEFENQKIEELQVSIAQRNGFVLTHHILELYGICQNCREKDSAPGSKTSSKS